MTKVSISRLKARLSDYVKLVRGGEEVVVTDRGVPVARIVPLDSDRWMKTRVMELVESGLARPPAARLHWDFWQRPRPEDPRGRIVESLITERREGR